MFNFSFPLTVSEIVGEPEALASLIGSIIAVLLAFVTLMINEWRHSVRENKNKEADNRAFLQSIKADLTILWARYEHIVGKNADNLKASEAFTANISVSQNYFALFDSNTHKIGFIDDVDLRNLIIHAYMLAKATIDNLILNNRINHKLELHTTYHLESEPDSHGALSHKNIANMYYESLKNFRNQMLEHDEEMRKVVPATIVKIDRALRMNTA